MPLDPEVANLVTRRGVVEIIDEAEFLHLLDRDEPLRLKMGFDPSAPDIHLGHVVGLRKLRQLQDLGHQVVLIVGDWTAQIGDPSGQSATRPMLTHEQVEANAQTYLRQFFRVIDQGRTEVIWQSEWFAKFGLEDVIRLTSRFTLAQFLQREDFRQRWDNNRPIGLTELLYPLLQAYDSVAVQADVEFGGTDQKFNLLVGRDLQAMMGLRPQQCYLVPMLVGTDGSHKMSKSLGNYIGVDESPEEQYGKVMSLPDQLICAYFELLTDISNLELREIQIDLNRGKNNPMELKKRLAREIVAGFWGGSGAQKAEAHFERVVQQRQIPEDIPVAYFYKTEDSSGQFVLRVSLATNDGRTIGCDVKEEPGSAVVVLQGLGFTSSKSEGRRLLSQGAVELDGEPIDEELIIRDGSVLRIGRRRFLRFLERK
ncbi:tyrosine--tRNA ligase [SAR202 cluster bacterium AD-802-E10_MRT_200m]|nr:tyrosine--tRNA ligase [SAR202 cluster bacterium AD-802-E10_MRT_200m]MQF82592.1 tyrosine--tRNA ligase [SAR202 cluster bacterium AD-802-E10_MRT_200m]